MELEQMYDLAAPLKGEWHFALYEGDIERDGDGRILNPLVDEHYFDNLITNVGKAQVLNRLYDLGSPVKIGFTGVGTSATAAAVGDTGLTGGVFKVFDTTPTAASAGSLLVASTTTFGTSEANINIQEACICTASPGVILNRLAPIGAFNKTSAVSLAVTVTITQT